MRNRLFFRRVLRAHHLFAGHRPPRCHPSRPSLKGYQRGRIPDQGIDIPFLSRAWPALPPRPCSSERAVPVMAGGARSWAATGHAGRRSVRGCVRTLERGNEQRPKLMGSRRGRSLDQGIDIPFLSRAWPAPPRPCSSERAVPAMGDRHGRWRPSARPDAGAAGAAFPRWSVGTSSGELPGCTVYIVAQSVRPRCRGEKFSAPAHPARMVANGARGAPFRKTTGYARSRVGCAARTMCEGPFRNDGVAVVHRPLGGASR